LIFRKAQFTPPLGHRDPFNNIKQVEQVQNQFK
jgi:hypothetical protein